MNQETKNCQNCKNDFTIEPEDFDFYTKINVPSPTFCPDCRLQRRLAFFNLVKLYKRDCDLCGKKSISMYHPDAPYTVYCTECWWSDSWDPLDYGREYDFSKPFFEQIDELWRSVPYPSIVANPAESEHSPYNNYSDSLKDCYLTFQTYQIDTAGYCNNMRQCKQTFDSNNIAESERIYDSIHVLKSYNCVGCYNLFESVDCYFLRDCLNCQNCFGCTNLKNKKYCFLNEQLTKEAYEEKLSELALETHTGYMKAKEMAHAFWRTQHPQPIYNMFSTNCVGNYVFDSNNCQQCFDVGGAENCKFIHMVLNQPISDSYDVTGWGDNQDLCYENCIAGTNVAKMFFVIDCGNNSHDCEYVRLVTRGSENCFASTGLRGKQYCIFNKQYTKEEYFELRDKIIKHMNEMPYIDKQGNVYTYGEFFPAEISPFDYKHTVAQNFFPLDQTEIDQKGLRVYKDLENEYAVTIQASQLPDSIVTTEDGILDEVIACERTGAAYKIQPIELQFHRQMNVPLPRVAPLERINEKINVWTKEMQLLERTSSISEQKFLTHYTEEEAPQILSPEEYKREYLS